MGDGSYLPIIGLLAECISYELVIGIRWYGPQAMGYKVALYNFSHDQGWSEEPRSKLRAILMDDSYPPDVIYPLELSHIGGYRTQNPATPFGRLGEIEPKGSIS